MLLIFGPKVVEKLHISLSWGLPQNIFEILPKGNQAKQTPYPQTP